jgi:hypothetical protein
MSDGNLWYAAHQNVGIFHVKTTVFSDGIASESAVPSCTRFLSFVLSRLKTSFLQYLDMGFIPRLSFYGVMDG